jgi:hypothetical protein
MLQRTFMLSTAKTPLAPAAEDRHEFKVTPQAQALHSMYCLKFSPHLLAAAAAAAAELCGKSQLT